MNLPAQHQELYGVWFFVPNNHCGDGVVCGHAYSRMCKLEATENDMPVTFICESDLDFQIRMLTRFRYLNVLKFKKRIDNGIVVSGHVVALDRWLALKLKKSPNLVGSYADIIKAWFEIIEKDFKAIIRKVCWFLICCHKRANCHQNLTNGIFIDVSGDGEVAACVGSFARSALNGVNVRTKDQNDLARVVRTIISFPLRQRPPAFMFGSVSLPETEEAQFLATKPQLDSFVKSLETGTHTRDVSERFSLFHPYFWKPIEAYKFIAFLHEILYRRMTPTDRQSLLPHFLKLGPTSTKLFQGLVASSPFWQDAWDDMFFILYFRDFVEHPATMGQEKETLVGQLSIYMEDGTILECYRVFQGLLEQEYSSLEQCKFNEDELDSLMGTV